MQVEDCPLAGLKLIRLKVHGDARGFFTERYNEAAFLREGLPTVFLQDNHSRSAPGTLRGLHYQYNKPQGKLVGVARGRIFDVAVDVRPASPTFGSHYGVELTDTGGEMLWVPAGFAHGFCVLGDEPADVIYKVDALYNAAHEGGIAYNDAELGIQWPVSQPLLSARDQVQPSFADYRKSPPPWE